MKPKVEITLVHEEGLLDDVTLGFTTLEQIDSFIETFEEMRADLEHQIEMEKQRKRDKRKRAKMRRKFENKELADTLNQIRSEMDEFDKLPVDEKINNILRDYESLEDDSKEILRPLMDIVKRMKKDSSLIKGNND